MFSGAAPVSLKCINCLKDIIGKYENLDFLHKSSVSEWILEN